MIQQIPFVDLKAQYKAYQSEIDASIKRVLEHGHYLMGPEITELESKLAERAGVSHCFTVSSGTAALEIALRALGIGPGDEVVTTPFTFVGTINAICLVGATPVLVDIDPQTYLIEIDQIEAAITERTKAIIPVSLYGQMPDMPRINTLAREHEIPVIEDAAQSFGASQGQLQSCGSSVIGCTSFYPSKPLGCYGDGGAVFTDDEEIAARLNSIRVHGLEKVHGEDLVGCNGRFDTIQAAVLLAKLKHFDREIELRNEVAEAYGHNLADVDAIELPKTLEGNRHTYAQYTIRCKNRDSIRAKLSEQGIPTGIYYDRLFLDRGRSKGNPPSLKHCERAVNEVLSLPMHPFLSAEMQKTVIEALTNDLVPA